MLEQFLLSDSQHIQHGVSTVTTYKKGRWWIGQITKSYVLSKLESPSSLGTGSTTAKDHYKLCHFLSHVRVLLWTSRTFMKLEMVC